MLRQNSSHTGISRPKTAVEMLREDSEIEALRAAYRAVVTASAHSVFTSGITASSSKMPSEPLLNAYQAAVAAFANSVFETDGLPTNSIDQFQGNVPAQPIAQQTCQTPIVESSPVTTPETSHIEEATTQHQSRPVAIVPAHASDYVPSFDPTLVPPPIAETTSSITGDTSIPTIESKPAPNELETQAMQEALDDAMGAACKDNRMFAEEEDFRNLPPAPETWLVKLCNRPRLAAGIIGMCVLSSTVYASLGYWFLNNASVSNAAEPVNLMNLQEDDTNGNATEKGQFNNLDKLQSPTHIIVPRETDGQTLLAQAAGSVKSALDDDIASIRNSIAEPIGRANPFAPLLGPNGEIQDSSLESKKKKDVLEDLQFIGFIGDINSRDKVAMIKVNDPTAGGGKTLIKKTGDSFMVEGERVVLRGISKNFLKLGVSGENRMLSISPYTELADTSANNASAASAGGAANGASPTTPAASVAPGKLGNLGALSKNVGNPTNPELQEPNQ